eukprot:CAMPEP_0178452370 /NCGR_PEP_ID=MMETSP0689_2-20121128/44208_1 /TAXON_ID=160604 /ORGANISM="Amphidinium massartii, Strain CS-259" /LENGTH=633 /DNA_ID=CAMNT_0020078071 /DNA_START=27 /DNA_END=1928 /DNA_ORIENTATION=-
MVGSISVFLPAALLMMMQGATLAEEDVDSAQCSGVLESIPSAIGQRALIQNWASASFAANISGSFDVNDDSSKPKKKGKKGGGAEGGAEGEGEEGMETHFTMHGCMCQHAWSWDGNELSGCSGDANVEFAGGHAWCKTGDDCESPAGELPDGSGKWDYCATDADVVHLRTLHGCHCNPIWEWKERVYESCGKTSKGPKWCYVFESDAMCPQAMRTEHGGQHWDYCYTADQTSPFLTRNGCHCMPEFSIDGVKYQACDTIKLGGKEFKGCVTLEDESACNAPFKVEGSTLLVDECMFSADEQEEMLDNLVEALSPDCHCQPVWQHNGQDYKDCAKTPDRGDRGWCYIMEDQRACPEEDGVNGANMQRWRWCEEDPNAGQTPPPTAAPAAPAATAAPVSPANNPGDNSGAGQPTNSNGSPDNQSPQPNTNGENAAPNQPMPMDGNLNSNPAAPNPENPNMPPNNGGNMPLNEGANGGNPENGAGGGGNPAAPATNEGGMPESNEGPMVVNNDVQAAGAGDSGNSGIDARYVHIVPVVVPYPTDAYQPQAPGGISTIRIGEAAEASTKVESRIEAVEGAGAEKKEEIEKKLANATVAEEKMLREMEDKEEAKSASSRVLAPPSLLIAMLAFGVRQA